MTRQIRTSERNIPWLTDIPGHWRVAPSKRLFTFRKQLAIPGDEQLSATQAYGVIPQKEFERRAGRRVVQVMQHLEKRRHVERDDFVISMRSFQGGLERAWATGCIRSSYVVLKPSAGVHVGYFAYLFKSSYYIQALQATSNYIRDGQDLNFDNFCLVDLPVVPMDEQRAIARFLNHADRRIRRYIHSKQKLIKLLEEQKQAIIHRAVTRGLDPNVRLKPSGIDWLGDVPEHWEVRRAKQLCVAIIDCKNRTPNTLPNGEYIVVRTSNVRQGLLDLAEPMRTDRRNYNIWTQRGAPQIGDVFFTREAPAGEACLVPQNDNLCMGQRMMYFRPDPQLLDPEFLLYSIDGPLVRTYVELTCSGSTVGHLRLGQVYSLPLLWCPIEEQHQIVMFLRDALSGIASVYGRTQREINLIREYRTRLVADVVTGKLDVRGVELPVLDETEAMEDWETEEDTEADEMEEMEGVDA